MHKTKLVILLYVSGALCTAMGGALASEDESRDWVIYTEASNGDLHFYDRAQVERAGTTRLVWSGIRYKTSLMGAFSHRSFVEIDCAARTEKILQSTFFSDDTWESPAMGTDKSKKAKTQIEAGSITERLAEIVCD